MTGFDTAARLRLSMNVFRWANQSGIDPECATMAMITSIANNRLPQTTSLSFFQRFDVQPL